MYLISRASFDWPQRESKIAVDGYHDLLRVREMRVNVSGSPNEAEASMSSGRSGKLAML